MEREELAYTAGLFDGEGYISIGISDGYHRPFVGMSNTHLATLTRLQQQWGGGVRRLPERPTETKPCYQWMIGGAIQVGEFLRAVRPWLIIKEPEAWLALEFLAQRRRCTRRQPVTPEEYALREGFRLAIREAKHA